MKYLLRTSEHTVTLHAIYYLPSDVVKQSELKYNVPVT